MKTTEDIQKGSDLIAEKLLAPPRPFTLNDAVALTGLRTDNTRKALEILIIKYHCILRVTENGDLIYDFGSTLRRRGERSWAEFVTMLWHNLLKILALVFKFWIAVTLVIYFIVFIVILVAMIIAFIVKLFSGGSDDDGGGIEGLGDLVGIFFRALFEIFYHAFVWHTHTNNYYYATDNEGYTYKQYEPKPAPLAKIDTKNKDSKTHKKSFVSSVYDFVFGPERLELHPLANQQEVASYLRKNKGLITTAEVIGLAGWRSVEAEDFLADCVARFNGEPKISENKVLYIDFYELNRSKNTQEDVPIVWYWDEYEPEYLLNGNTWWTNAGIIFMSIINLFFGILFIGLTEQPIDEILQGSSPTEIFFIRYFLGFIPTFFTLIFFTIPILRYFYIQPARFRRVQNNIRKRIYKAIFQHYQEDITLDKLEKWVNTGKEVSLSRSTIEKHLKQAVQDLWGNLKANTQTGQVSYTFDRIKDELTEIKRLRNNIKDNNDLGNIVLDTE